MNKLFTVKGGKFKISAHGRDLVPFVGNGPRSEYSGNIGFQSIVEDIFVKFCNSESLKEFFLNYLLTAEDLYPCT